MSSRNNKIISCLCGGIKLKVNGLLRHVSNCHCFQCMKTHGNYSAYTNAKEKDVIFLKRRTLKWFRSSKKAKRGFCKKCGSTLSYCGEKFGNDKIFIATVAFKNPNLFPPTEQVFTCESLDWMNPNNKIPKFDKLR